MSLKTIEINSVKIAFDKEKTKAYRTDYNIPCDCPNCKNYYKHISLNSELVKFLADFGIDYNFTEEVFSLDVEIEEALFIHQIGYYGVFGRIDGEDFDFEEFGVKISFSKGASSSCDSTGEYFWICIEGDFPRDF